MNNVILFDFCFVLFLFFCFTVWWIYLYEIHIYICYFYWLVLMQWCGTTSTIISGYFLIKFVVSVCLIICYSCFSALLTWFWSWWKSFQSWKRSPYLSSQNPRSSSFHTTYPFISWRWWHKFAELFFGTRYVTAQHYYVSFSLTVRLIYTHSHLSYKGVNGKRKRKTPTYCFLYALSQSLLCQAAIFYNELLKQWEINQQF